MPISEYMRRLRERVGHELLLMPAVSVAIFDERERLLLARHAAGGVWATPGGSGDPHETPADAAVREVWEETGLSVEPVRVLGVHGGPEFEVVYDNGDRVSYLMVVLEARILGGEPRPDGEETLELGWFGAGELAGLHIPAWARTVLPKLFGDRGETRFQAPRWVPPQGPAPGSE